MKLKLVSRGLRRETTRVIDPETGKMIEGLQAVELYIDCEGVNYVRLTVANVDVDCVFDDSQVSFIETKKESYEA